MIWLIIILAILGTASMTLKVLLITNIAIATWILLIAAFLIICIIIREILIDPVLKKLRKGEK